jgi:hypothetical protein
MVFEQANKLHRIRILANYFIITSIFIFWHFQVTFTINARRCRPGTRTARSNPIYTHYREITAMKRGERISNNVTIKINDKLMSVFCKKNAVTL